MERLIYFLFSRPTFLQKKKNSYTYLYISLQFPAEMNVSVSKTPTTCDPFHTNYDYRSRLSMNNRL